MACAAVLKCMLDAWITSIFFNASNLDVVQHVSRPCNLQLVHPMVFHPLLTLVHL